MIFGARRRNAPNPEGVGVPVFPALPGTGSLRYSAFNRAIEVSPGSRASSSGEDSQGRLRGRRELCHVRITRYDHPPPPGFWTRTGQGSGRGSKVAPGASATSRNGHYTNIRLKASIGAGVTRGQLAAGDKLRLSSPPPCPPLNLSRYPFTHPPVFQQNTLA